MYPFALFPVTQGDANPQSALLLSVPLWLVSPQIEVTAKLMPLLAAPPTVTTTFPVVAPVGTDVAMLVEVQLVVVVGVPLNVTVPEDPKLVPVIVTAVPTGPEVVDRLVIFGDTVEVPPLNAIAACSQEVAVHVVFHIFVAATLVLFSLSANFTSLFPIRCP